MGDTAVIQWLDELVDVNGAHVLFYGMAGDHRIAGAVPLKHLRAAFPASAPDDPDKLYRAIAPKLHSAVEQLYGMGRFSEHNGPGGALRHRRVDIIIPPMR